MSKIYQAYRRKRKNQIIVAILFIPIFFILLYPELTHKDTLFGLDMDTITSYLLIPIVVAVAYSFYNWRCPVCKKYLGRRINHKSCPRCDEPFTE